MRIPVPTIETDRLLLRRFTAADLENVFRGLSHPDVIRYYGVSFRTMEEAKEQMEWFAGHEENGTGIWWAVCDKANGEFVGAGGLNDLLREHAKAEVGFWLLPEYWGRGYMMEAFPRILEYGFDALDLHRIEGFVVSDNGNCKRALDRIGFEYEGTMRDSEFKDGQYISVDIYAKINPKT